MHVRDTLRLICWPLLPLLERLKSLHHGVREHHGLHVADRLPAAAGVVQVLARQERQDLLQARQLHSLKLNFGLHLSSDDRIGASVAQCARAAVSAAHIFETAG
eukprot:6212169-Pleurochrysis_carterae.AAC.1